ncbi:MAG TPA: methyltransferase [Anaerolineae bacterium]|nr:methyltransferase [Anaerolineae bacterium]
MSSTISNQPLWVTPNTGWGRWRAALWRRLLTWRHQLFPPSPDRLTLEYIDVTPFIVLPTVFNPVLFRTGRFLAQTITNLPLKPNQVVLDLGTGSGVGAIFAAQQGTYAIASDINPDAVRCARLNADLNHLSDRVICTTGDLFSAVTVQKFDWVFFNPPFYQGKPQHVLDYAWRGEAVFERFTAQLRPQLTATGHAVLILSSDGDGQHLINLLQNSNYTLEIINRQNLINEILTAYLITP